MKPTVYAVCTVVLEVPVRPSSSGETLEVMHEIAEREAVQSVQNMLKDGATIKSAKFSHAIVKSGS